jgi:hypothetical protein
MHDTMDSDSSAHGQHPMGEDLSALAWVHGELKRALETAHKALHRYLKEADAIGGSDVGSVDPSVLRMARNQLHQGVGALELVGLPAVADVLRSAETAVQRMVSKPALVDAATRGHGREGVLCAAGLPGAPVGRQAGVAGGAVSAVPRRAATGRRRPRAPGRPVEARLAVVRSAGRPVGHPAQRRRRRPHRHGNAGAGAACARAAQKPSAARWRA